MSERCALMSKMFLQPFPLGESIFSKKHKKFNLVIAQNSSKTKNQRLHNASIVKLHNSENSMTNMSRKVKIIDLELVRHLTKRLQCILSPCLLKTVHLCRFLTLLKDQTTSQENSNSLTRPV